MSFDELDRLLRRAGAPVDAAECHGALCGALCSPTPDTDAWLAHELEGVADTGARAPLVALAADTERRLREGDFEFSPCLPDDDEPLRSKTLRHRQLERAAALARETLRLGRASDQVSHGTQRFPGRGAKLQGIRAEHDQNAGMGRGEWRKSERYIGH